MNTFFYIENLSKIGHLVEGTKYLLKNSALDASHQKEILGRLEKPITLEELDSIVREILGPITKKGNKNDKNLKSALIILSGVTHPSCIRAELEEIKKGHYQEQVLRLTHDHLESFLKRDTFNISEWACDQIGNFYNINYEVHKLMNAPGLRCTLAIKNPPEENAPLEIQINFFGTMDFASLTADIEQGGPGQLTLKKYEHELMKRLNAQIGVLKARYPEKEIRLKIAGHSLGGSLAKGFTYSVQRAIAVQDQNPDEIINTLSHLEGIKNNRDIFEQAKGNLKNKLLADQHNFKNLSNLKDICGITLYALGAPGVSKETDLNATFLTYAKEANFIRVYRHHHAKDTICCYGDCDLFSGTQGIPPNIQTNLTIKYHSKLTAEEVNAATPLPFPRYTKEAQAAHITRIQSLPKETRYCMTSEIINQSAIGGSQQFEFNYLYRQLLEVIFYLLKYCENKMSSKPGELFYTYPTEPTF